MYLRRNSLSKYKSNISNYFSSASEDVLSSPVLNEGTSISELPGYVGPSASNVEVDAAENARGELMFCSPYIDQFQLKLNKTFLIVHGFNVKD